MKYKDGYRKKDNVVGYGNVWLFDIDSKEGAESYSINEVLRAVEGIESLIVTTRSHTDKYHRLRLVVLADQVITHKIDDELYREIMRTIIKFLGLELSKFDSACFNSDRQYAPNRVNQQKFYQSGDLIPISDIYSIAKEKLMNNQMTTQKELNIYKTRYVHTGS